jgi:hypothetical protein
MTTLRSADGPPATTWPASRTTSGLAVRISRALAATAAAFKSIRVRPSSSLRSGSVVDTSSCSFGSTTPTCALATTIWSFACRGPAVVMSSPYKVLDGDVAPI